MRSRHHSIDIMTSPRQITVRNPSPELTRRLKAIAEARGQSLNTTILELLQEAVGINGRRERLQRYATWTQQDYEEFESAQALQRTIDEDLWR